MINPAAAPTPLSRLQHGMTFSVLFLVFAACTALATSASAQIVGHRAFGKDDKPADPNFSFTRETFDCTARDTFSLNTDTSFSLSDSTINSSSLLNTYSCLSWPEEGPENIYRLDVTADLELFAGLRDLGEIDLDIFLLGGCDTEMCLTGHNTEFTIVLSPGTYYLVVDGYGRLSNGELPGSTFTLLVECRWLGLPPAICEEAGATPVECATNIITLDGQLFEKPNLVQSYECSPNILRGGEHWFAITLEPQHGFIANTSAVSPTIDQALWLFDGCGEGAQCIGYSDEKNSGQGEALSYTNELETSATVYFATDSFRVTDNETNGAFVVEFDCQSFVATVPTNMGSMRALYR